MVKKGKSPKKEPDAKELTETLQRVQADFENYQKRIQSQMEEYKKHSNGGLILELLPVLDTLESGIIHNKEFGKIRGQLYSVLEKNGLKKMKVEPGQDFNHDKMDCMLQETNKKLPDGKVTKVLLHGYELNGKVLRPAKIAVNNIGKEKNKKN